VVYELSR